MTRKLIKLFLPLAVLFACLGFAACDTSPDNLSAPQNLRVEEGVIYWDEVEYADSYSVFINNAEYTTTECSYAIADFSETEIYSVEVRAYTKGGLCSFFSDITYTGIFALPTEGIEYSMNRTGENPRWSVTKLAVDSNGSCVIPATYEGVPVTHLDLINQSIDQPIAPKTPQQVLSRIKNLYVSGTIQGLVPQSNGVSPIVTQITQYLPNLEKIMIGEGCDELVSTGDCVYNKNTNTLVVGCLGGAVPQGVTTIGRLAFAGRNILEFTVPGQITAVNEYAFSNCTQLKKCVFPENFSGKSLERVFEGCSSLMDVDIPEGVTSLEGTFGGCTSLQSVNIPSTVTELNVTFWFCTSLKSFTVHGNVKKIEGAFYGCTSLKSVVLSEGVEELITVKDYSTYGAFENCISLQNISLPSTLTKIDSLSFVNCVSLKSIEIPERVTDWGYKIFRNCTALESVRLPQTAEKLKMGSNTFENCSSLKIIDLPNGLEELFSNFRGCTALKTLVFPKGVKVINGAFDESSNIALEEILYKGTEEDWQAQQSIISQYNNEKLFAATRYYYSQNTPQTEGNYWHYVGGVPVKWPPVTA